MHTLPPPAITRAKAATDHSVMPTRPEMPPPGDKQAMRFTRSPPKTPVLREEYRYCRKDEFLKPLRAHHCRACGTVSIPLCALAVVLTRTCASVSSSTITIAHGLAIA